MMVLIRFENVQLGTWAARFNRRTYQADQLTNEDLKENLQFLSIPVKLNGTTNEFGSCASKDCKRS